MYKLLSIIFIAFVSLSAAPIKSTTLGSPDARVATCKGAKPCNACKNCKYCKHCKKDGGTCGICK